MTMPVDLWEEQARHRRDAINGSRKLLLAILRAQGIFLWQPLPPKKRTYPLRESIRRNPKVAKFEAPVADHYGMDAALLQSHTRARAIARPRQVVMYLAHTYGNASYPEIGRHYGMDHTTALSGCRAVAGSSELLEAAHRIFAGLSEERIAA